jgi:hypothetical protein
MAMQRNEMNMNMTGHVLIRDKETKEVIFDGFNAIHYGNMAFIVAQALNRADDAYIHFMAFGNGATSVDTSGRVIYKSPRVTEGFDAGATLYSRTYEKVISEGTETDNIQVIPGVSYTDLQITCTLGFNEPEGQDVFDSSTTNEGDFIFDELALFTFPSDGESIDESIMLTHVVFHPVQKSTNRIIEIIYTVRVQLS